MKHYVITSKLVRGNKWMYISQLSQLSGSNSEKKFNFIIKLLTKSLNELRISPFFQAP